METSRAINLEDIYEAEKRVKLYAHHTPLLSIPTTILDMIKDVSGCSELDVRLKCENFQRVGAFKIRGAYNAIAKTKELEPDLKLVVTHSSGNHGQAVANVAQHFGLEAVIVVPYGANPTKIQAIHAYGAQSIPCDSKKREAVCHEIAEERRKLLGDSRVLEIPSYNHPLIMAGQGTMALEIFQDWKDVDLIICPIGGGGLISGIATAVKGINSKIRIVGVEPRNANDALRSKQAGEHLMNPDIPNTIADGLKTNLGNLTWPCVRDLVDLILDVTESEISTALELILTRMKIVIEPSSACVIAALLSTRFWNITENRSCKSIVAVISGGNLTLSDIPNLLEKKE